VNFSRDVVDAAPRDRVALVELARDGNRRTWSFGEVADASSAFARVLRDRGVGRGDVVLTLVGNRPEWVLAMVACFRIGAVVLPCTEQLRPHDLRLRIDVAAPRIVVTDERNAAAVTEADPGIEQLVVPDEHLFSGPGTDAVDLAPEDPCLVTFTSGTSGMPKAALHAQRYLTGQALQGRHWLGVSEGDVVWCTAASGWSKSARNVFIAPWLLGATAVLHDARFDAADRLRIVEAEGVDVLCMAPTEYRVIAKRATLAPFSRLRTLVAAGEALEPETQRLWEQGTGLTILDGYGQTETGSLTGVPQDEAARPGSMGRPLPGVDAWIDDGELVVGPASVPTFFLGYLGREPWDPTQPWRTGDRVRVDDDGWFFFDGRADDIIISAGYRIGPFEVESALMTHALVAEVAVVSAPDPERGAVVRAVVALVDGATPSDELRAELQDHVKARTAPYKYPRIVDFVDSIPKTASGKVRRALLREQHDAAPR